MKVSKFYFPLLAAAMFASCSSEAIDGPNSPAISEKDGVNMKISVSLPASNGTRAAGDPGESIGEEIGKTFENNVKEVLLVLADKGDNSFIASNLVTIADGTTSSSTYELQATFNKSVLINYINSLSSQSDQVPVSVYAFCNPTQDFKSLIATRSRGDKAETWINAKNTLSADNLSYEDISKAANIPMSNASVRSSDDKGVLKLPKKDDIESGKWAEDPYPMGSVDVIRSIARFDYKSKNNNLYGININVSGDKGVTTIEDGLQIELTHMALVNMSKSYYYLHRISSTGDAAGFETPSNFTICGADAKDKFVVDTDWEWKNAANWTNTQKYSDKFHYPLYTDGTTENPGVLDAALWNRVELSKLTVDDEDETWNTSHGNDGYKIWRYVTENTIPEPAQKQKTAVSTGVVFRGVMKSTDNTPQDLKDALAQQTEPIYIYKDGTIFANWEAVKTFAEKPANANTALADAYNACKDKTGNDLVKEAVKNKFTVYRYDADVNGFVTLYYYWNRHWDNGNNGVMGDMEFAVVRNNVYKLSVTDISGLGHPRNPGDDPDPVDPDDPDEKSDVKIKVDVQVKKWTVRVNNIKF